MLPNLTPEQLNAIDLLILGKTDREVSEIVGVRRETVTKWHKNPFSAQN
jgi:transposase